MVDQCDCASSLKTLGGGLETIATWFDEWQDCGGTIDASVWHCRCIQEFLRGVVKESEADKETLAYRELGIKSRELEIKSLKGRVETLQENRDLMDRTINHLRGLTNAYECDD